MTDSLSRKQDNVTALHPEPTFDDFWHHCYHKVDKLLARAKWDAITSEAGLDTQIRDKETGALVAVHLKATPGEIVEGMKRFMKNWPRLPNYQGLKDPQYIPRPPAWLNRGRWLDNE